MASPVEHRFENVASGRDLVAKVVEAAQAAKATPQKRHKVILLNPKLSADRALTVFGETLEVITQGLAEKLSLEVRNTRRPSTGLDNDVLTLPARPNAPYDLLRHLIDASILGHPPVPGQALSAAMGLSEHPIREASKALEAAGLVRTTHEGRSLVIEPWECTPELLARIDARPIQALYRYRTGATPLRSDSLSRRFDEVWAEESLYPWLRSGVDAAQLVSGHIDLSGAPRVDLVVRVPAKQRVVDLSWLGEIVPRMEREPNPLELAPLVVTIVQEELPLSSEDTYRRVASYADIVLALLSQGLVKQAREFAADARAAD